MSNIDSTGRIPPPRRSISSSSPSVPENSSSPPPSHHIFPSYNITTSPFTQTSPSSSTSSNSPSSHLPYLRDSSPSPIASTSQTPPSPTSPPTKRTKPPPLSLSTSSDQNTAIPSPAKSSKKRPSPLFLGRAKAVGLDEELEVQRDWDLASGQLTAKTGISDDARSTLSNDMQDLSLLRQSVKQNLNLRPMDSPLGGSDSGGSTGFATPDRLAFQGVDIPESQTIPISEVLSRVDGGGRSGLQVLIVDARPIGAFLEGHLPGSSNVSIPSLIFKRLRKSTGSTSWAALGSFVSTPAGKGVWDGVDRDKEVDVVIVGTTAGDETVKVLRDIVEGLLEGGGSVKVLRGGWQAVLENEGLRDKLVSGEWSEHATATTSTSTSLPPHKPGSVFDLHQLQPISPDIPAPKLANRPSLPSLRQNSSTQRNLPTLSIPGGISRRPPKLSLNLDRSRSATAPSFPSDIHSHIPNPSLSKTKSHLDINVNASNSAPKSSNSLSSFQTLCHAQSKLPPSPSSFGVQSQMTDSEDVISPSARSPKTPWSNIRTARPDHHSQFVSGGTMTARNGLSPFIVSTILPSFLYLGPEIASLEDVEKLKQLGVKRILNVALECDDDEGLGLRESFERYLRVPMRDIVEESGVGRGIRESCGFLDDARLHSSPTYVHCKAGKSRSVTVVLAYLIHANAWTLKTSYAYVAERRKGISPNIGFVAELMQFEESELGLKQSGGVHGDSGGGTGGGGGKDGDDREEGGGRRHVRESLPPAWSASLDSKPPRVVGPHGGEGEDEGGGNGDEDGRRRGGEEKEVRKNGQWVHSRRAPVDRTTLQPGRRVSKAGLESLRPLQSTTSPRPSPQPSPDAANGDKAAMTPRGDGRQGWV